MIKRFFDYVFYRIAKFYYKWDGSTANTATVGLSLVQVLYIGLMVIGTIGSIYSRDDTYRYSKTMGSVGVGILMALIILNSIVYNDRYILLRRRWGTEPNPRKLVRGMGVLFFMLFPLLGMLFLGTRP